MGVKSPRSIYAAFERAMKLAFLPYVESAANLSQYRRIIVPLENAKAHLPCEIYTGLDDQALVFEAPCLALDDEQAAALSERCAKIAQKFDPRITAQIEFRVKDDGQIYFSGIDAGQSAYHSIAKLALQKGWAMGTHIWARSAGSIVNYSHPISQGFEALKSINANGGEVLSRGDLLTTLAAWGEDRGEAHQALAYGLDALEIHGVATTRSLASAILAHDRFMRGDMSEAFMDEEYPEGFGVVNLGIGHSRHIAAICAILRARTQNITQQSHWDVQVNDDMFTVELSGTGQVILAAIDEDSDKATVEIEVTTDWKIGERVVILMIDGRKMVVQASKAQSGYDVDYRGGKLSVTLSLRG